MPKFFVPAEAIQANEIVLTAQNAAHANVLRLRPGEEVIACDGCGTDYRCTVSTVQADRVCLTVREAVPSCSEPCVRASIYMAYAKADKLEHVIQKATELGAYEIVAFPSDRCVSRPDDKSLAKKLERWQKIAASAAEQSGRGTVPQVVTLSSFRAAVARALQAELAVNFYENEHARTFSAALADGLPHTVSLMTGPEGGYTEAEVAYAAAQGMQTCTLGRRILRCETAPLCALSALMYACGEF